jgi:prolipoprotein diacylglyceryltransferase
MAAMALWPLSPFFTEDTAALCTSTAQVFIGGGHVGGISPEFSYGPLIGQDGTLAPLVCVAASSIGANTYGMPTGMLVRHPHHILENIVKAPQCFILLWRFSRSCSVPHLSLSSSSLFISFLFSF